MGHSTGGSEWLPTAAPRHLWLSNGLGSGLPAPSQQGQACTGQAWDTGPGRKASHHDAPPPPQPIPAPRKLRDCSRLPAVFSKRHRPRQKEEMNPRGSWPQLARAPWMARWMASSMVPQAPGKTQGGTQRSQFTPFQTGSWTSRCPNPCHRAVWQGLLTRASSRRFKDPHGGSSHAHGCRAPHSWASPADNNDAELICTDQIWLREAPPTFFIEERC